MQPFKLMKRVVEILLRRRSSLPVFYLPIHTREKRDKTEVEKEKKRARRSVSISQQPSKEYI